MDAFLGGNQSLEKGPFSQICYNDIRLVGMVDCNQLHTFMIPKNNGTSSKTSFDRFISCRDRIRITASGSFGCC